MDTHIIIHDSLPYDPVHHNQGQDAWHAASLLNFNLDFKSVTVNTFIDDGTPEAIVKSFHHIDHLLRHSITGSDPPEILVMYGVKGFFQSL